MPALRDLVVSAWVLVESKSAPHDTTAEDLVASGVVDLDDRSDVIELVPPGEATEAREGLVAVQRTVTRGGATFTQTFYVRPDDPRAQAGASAPSPAVVPPEPPKDAAPVAEPKVAPVEPKAPAVTPLGDAAKAKDVSVLGDVTARAKEIFGADLSLDELEASLKVPPGYNIAMRMLKADVTDDMGPRLKYTAQITTPEGDHVGNVERSFYKGDDGSPHVNHDLIDLLDEHQGKGISKSLLRSSLALYEKKGVKRVTLTASAGGHYVGSQVWGKMGFTWANEEVAEEMREAFAAHLESYMKPVSAKSFAKSFGSSPEKISRLEYRGEQVGREFLMTQDWNGKLDLTPGDPGFEKFKSKIGYRSDRRESLLTWARRLVEGHS